MSAPTIRRLAKRLILKPKFGTLEQQLSVIEKNKNRHYSISNKKSYSILEAAKLFSPKIKMLPTRLGERYASALTNMNLSNKVYKMFGKKDLQIYIENFKANFSKVKK